MGAVRRASICACMRAICASNIVRLIMGAMRRSIFLSALGNQFVFKDGDTVKDAGGIVHG